MTIGVLTYHSAYNFGSVLQAYATQRAVEKIGHRVSVINYRMTEQKRFYNNLYRTNYGVKTLVMDLMQLPIHEKRKSRAIKFEAFIESYLNLTNEVSEPEDVIRQIERCQVCISGSDQIWSKHSLELEHNDWNYMSPYLLQGYHGRKVSYASSVGRMTDDDLLRIIPELQEFNALSFRESQTAEKMSVLLDRSVETVLDPTFLLPKTEWIEQMNLQNRPSEKYILAYFLCGPKQLIRFLPILAKFAEKRKCHVKLITPFAYLFYPNKRIEYHPEYGPIEFLEALYNADTVVTDSYHGTIMSVNFAKEFYSVCGPGSAEFRKTDILCRLELMDRVVNGIGKLPEVTNDIMMLPELNLPPIDYDAVYAKLDVLRQKSMNYLKKALE